jgi:hypothetical protein
MMSAALWDKVDDPSGPFVVKTLKASGKLDATDDRPYERPLRFNVVGLIGRVPALTQLRRCGLTGFRRADGG